MLDLDLIISPPHHINMQKRILQKGASQSYARKSDGSTHLILEVSFIKKLWFLKLFQFGEVEGGLSGTKWLESGSIWL